MTCSVYCDFIRKIKIILLELLMFNFYCSIRRSKLEPLFSSLVFSSVSLNSGNLDFSYSNLVIFCRINILPKLKSIFSFVIERFHI